MKRSVFRMATMRDVHNCLAERRKNSCRAALVRPAATAAILEVDPVEAYLIWQFTDSWLPYVEEEYPERHEGDAKSAFADGRATRGFCRLRGCP